MVFLYLGWKAYTFALEKPGKAYIPVLQKRLEIYG